MLHSDHLLCTLARPKTTRYLATKFITCLSASLFSCVQDNPHLSTYIIYSPIYSSIDACCFQSSCANFCACSNGTSAWHTLCVCKPAADYRYYPNAAHKACDTSIVTMTKPVHTQLNLANYPTDTHTVSIQTTPSEYCFLSKYHSHSLIL